jgi:fibro-slime domain-containing protein
MAAAGDGRASSPDGSVAADASSGDGTSAAPDAPLVVDGDAGPPAPPRDARPGDEPPPPPPDGADGPDPRCVLRATIRDFRAVNPDRHPDFERSPAPSDPCPGMVENILTGANLAVAVPVLRDLGSSPCPDVFFGWPQIERLEDWYRDKPGINIRFDIELPLVKTDTGGRRYFNDNFFPVDGKGWNDEMPNIPGRNYGFTTHVAEPFHYRPGQYITFAGEDDFWLFIDGRLVIDMGGTHQSTSATVRLSDLRPALVDGSVHWLHIFHAERHTISSGFHIETDICP